MGSGGAFAQNAADFARTVDEKLTRKLAVRGFLRVYLLSRLFQCLKVCSMSDNKAKTGLIWLE